MPITAASSPTAGLPKPVDGCKLPSNASKKSSGTHKELDEKRKKLERVAERIAQRHRERDGQECDSAGAPTEPEKAQRYRKKVAEIKDFLAKNNKKRGPTGNEQKSEVCVGSANAKRERTTSRNCLRPRTFFTTKQTLDVSAPLGINFTVPVGTCSSTDIALIVSKPRRRRIEVATFANDAFATQIELRIVNS
jgi:hypothetical protein